jgi:hypothetical protein
LPKSVTLDLGFVTLIYIFQRKAVPAGVSVLLKNLSLSLLTILIWNLNVSLLVLIAVPSGAPTDIRAEARSSTELFVSWEPPEREFWNGNLLGYYVGYQEQSSLTTVSSSPSTTTHNYNFKTVEVGAQYGGEVLLQGLAKHTTYSIMVQAYNSRGAGPSSEHITARTQEDGECKFCLYVMIRDSRARH